MAKKIIALTINDKGDGTATLSYIFWITVKDGQELEIPTFTSQWRGASADELRDLQKGSLIERIKTRNLVFDPENVPRSIANAKANIEAEFAAEQARQDARINPNKFYGVTFDSDTGWSPIP